MVAVSEAKKQNNGTGEGCNLVVLAGEVSTAPVIRELPSGDVLVGFDLRVRQRGGPAQSLPVTWIGSEQAQPAVDLGKVVAVLGAVNRRFYRSGSSGLQSRVDVRAEKIVMGGPAKRRAAVARFIKGKTP